MHHDTKQRTRTPIWKHKDAKIGCLSFISIILGAVVLAMALFRSGPLPTVAWILVGVVLFVAMIATVVVTPGRDHHDH